MYEWFYGILSYLHLLFIYFLDKLLVGCLVTQWWSSECLFRTWATVYSRKATSQSILFIFNVTFKSVFFFSNAELTWTLPSQPHCWMSRGTRACSFYVYGTTLGNSTWSSLTLKLSLVCPEPQLLRSARRVRINRSWTTAAERLILFLSLPLATPGPPTTLPLVLSLAPTLIAASGWPEIPREWRWPRLLGRAYFKSRTKRKRKKKEWGKRHGGMKTALGGGSQHREKAVNDSGGGGINNAALPLSLHPSVPRSLSLSLFPHPHSLRRSRPLCIFLRRRPPPPSPLPSQLAPHRSSQASGLSSRGSSYQRASAASLSLSFPAGRAAARERRGAAAPPDGSSGGGRGGAAHARWSTPVRAGPFRPSARLRPSRSTCGLPRPDLWAPSLPHLSRGRRRPRPQEAMTSFNR